MAPNGSSVIQAMVKRLADEEAAPKNEASRDDAESKAANAELVAKNRS
jgi:hypothetical protein